MKHTLFFQIRDGKKLPTKTNRRERSKESMKAARKAALEHGIPQTISE